MSDTDALSHGEAHALLMAADQPPEEVVTPPTPAAEEAPAEEIIPEPTGEEPEAAPAEEGEVEETEEAAADPVTPPDKWDAEDKAWFVEQPPEVQAKILEQETKREAVLQKRIEKATTEAKQSVEKEVSEIKAVADDLAKTLPKAVATFQQRWGEPDWVATLAQYGPEETMRLQFERRQEAEHLRTMLDAQEQAQAALEQQRIKTETEKLKTLAPELASDATKQKEVATYLLSNGATKDDLASLPAWAAVLAHRAYLYDKAQAAAKTPPKPAPSPAKPVLKPSTAQSTPQSERTATQLANRFAQTGSREDAHALLLLKGI